MERDNKYTLEELGYNKDEVLEILGFKACFQIKSRCGVGEESAARLYIKFNGYWEAAGLWYRFVDMHYKKMRCPLSERSIIDEVVNELDYYKGLIKGLH